MFKWLAISILVLALLIWLFLRPASRPAGMPEIAASDSEQESIAATPLPAKAKNAFPAEFVAAVKVPEANVAGKPLAMAESNSEPGPDQKLTSKILRDVDGNFLKLENTEAEAACAKQRMRLPTIRELARLAQGQGAIGIMEPKFVRDGDVAEGFSRHLATNPDGRKEEFYFNPKGYRPTPGESVEMAYWSSSLCIGCVSGSGENSRHSLHGNGIIADHYDSVKLAVKCVANP